MNPWLETGLVLVIVGAAVAWAVRRFLRARRAVVSDSPCASCGQVGACPVVQNGAGTQPTVDSSGDSSGDPSCPKP